ncbi:hypothetical protein COB87_002700 [Candidatus Wolfebacteria bacterium]|nr:hypothetical protein [Candidatus Wolfebacteria bacterium]
MEAQQFLMAGVFLFLYIIATTSFLGAEYIVKKNLHKHTWLRVVMDDEQVDRKFLFLLIIFLASFTILVTAVAAAIISLHF